MNFIILFAALFAAHVILTVWGGVERRKSEDRSTGGVIRGLSIALIAVEAVFAGLFVLLLWVFDHRWEMRVLYLLAALLLLWLLAGLLFHKFTKKRVVLWLVCALLVGGGIGGIEGYAAYIRSITLKEQFDYRTYLPFREDSLVRTLDEPASLRFTESDDLPRLDGATALYPIYSAFCQAVYPPSVADGSLSDTIDCSTTASAYRRIVDGICDVVFVGGPSETQEAYAQENGVELVYTPIGREAFVFFVHPDNPVDSLTLEQVRGIYSGEITDWAQLGAEGFGKILAYQRDEGSGSQTALERYVMGDTPLMPAAKEEVIDGMGGIVEQVSAYQNHKNAIGYSFRFYCTALMKGFDVKLLKIDGVAPTVENIENGTYPLASTFFAVTRSDADGNTRALVEWICGAQGQALIEKTGYTPVAE